MTKYAPDPEDQPHLHMVPGVEFYGERLHVYATERQAQKVGEALRHLLIGAMDPAVLALNGMVRMGAREDDQ